MLKAIQNEIKKAKEKGLVWTPWRRFKFKYERVGAAICLSSRHSEMHTRRKPTEFVSYATDGLGRAALCGSCANKLDVTEGAVRS